MSDCDSLWVNGGTGMHLYNRVTPVFYWNPLGYDFAGVNCCQGPVGGVDRKLHLAICK